MTPEQDAHVTQWVVALRSGKYKQARHRLKNGDGYCCLGVACIVAGKEFDENDVCGGESQVLPCEIMDIYGLLDKSGSAGETTSLASMNDAFKTFTDIADFIESHKSELFV